MAEPDFRIKTGDNASSISSYLENSGGTAVSVAGATVLFKAAAIQNGGTLVTAGTAVIDGSGTAGHVTYAWPSGGFTSPGLYVGEWEVTFSGGTVQTFPNDGYVYILATDDLPVA